MNLNRKRKLVWDIILAAVFLFCFVCFLLRVKGTFTTRYYSSKVPSAIKDDDFDISLLRLNTMARLEDYCDSVYKNNRQNTTYPWIVSEVMRKKFYHGYSYYDAYSNPMAAFFAPVIKNGLAAIVIPDDIVKYPFAACSQQSIVGMEIFKRIGYQVRGVIMFDTLTQTGHFAYEVFYDGDWHYFDSNQEPDVEVLKKYNRPSVAFLTEHPEVIAAAYYNRDHQLFQRLLKSSRMGQINKNPAPNAFLFQTITRYLTYFGWALVWLVFIIRNRILDHKPIISFTKIKKGSKQSHPEPILSR